MVDARGRSLWTKTFGYPLDDYQKLSADHLHMGWVGDLDGDGEPEVLFLAHPKAEGRPMLLFAFRRHSLVLPTRADSAWFP